MTSYLATQLVWHLVVRGLTEVNGLYHGNECEHMYIK